MHGGGFAICGLDTHDAMCRQICRRSGAVMVAVDYALAPEHPFPAGLDDCRAALRWLSGNAERIGADARRLALCGDSAGANLAIGLALSGVDARALALVYPVTDHYSAGHGSYDERGAGCGLTAGEMRWFWDMYLPDPALALPGPMSRRCEPPIFRDCRQPSSRRPSMTCSATRVWRWLAGSPRPAFPFRIAMTAT